MTLQEKLFELKDEKYADFQAGLTPGVVREQIIGVRIPKIRALAREVARTDEANDFLNTLPHKYYDENMLHSVLLSGIKDYEECLSKIEAFLPYVNNWATCDTLLPKVFGKHKDDILVKIREWAKSSHTFTCRFGIHMLMNYYLDADFKEEYLEIPAAIHSDEYYIKMMNAWYYATALAKQWDATIKIIEEKRLDAWVHNKSIQKARESYRITDEQKEYLKSLKV